MSDDTPVRVVLVDDHPVVRDGLRGMFATEPGIEVVGEAASGPEALALCAHLDPVADVVLMDLRMPGGDGIDAVRALRERGPRPAVLVLSTYADDADVRAAITAGADGYLLKDARREDLVRAVRDVACGRAALAPEALRALATRPLDLPDLSPREIEVLRVIAAGGTNRTAADRLFVSEATVKTHLQRAYAKLGVNDRAAAVRVAFERGLL